MYNKVILIGNLTRDVELRTTPDGTAVANFNLAVNSKFGEKEETYFGEIQVWGKQAENAEKYLSKGARCLVEGRIKNESWEKDGEKKTKTRIVAEKIKFLTPKGSGRNDAAPEEFTESEPF